MRIFFVSFFFLHYIGLQKENFRGKNSNTNRNVGIAFLKKIGPCLNKSNLDTLTSSYQKALDAVLLLRLTTDTVLGLQ